MARVAIIQRPPVFLDRAATLRAAVESVREAARGGAQMLVFPEAHVPGYPAWIWRLRPGPDMGLTEKIHARLLANAVDLASDHLAPLQEAAREHRVTVVCGLDEVDASVGGSTLYNTVVVIGADGEVVNRHRKLMPTNPERMVWGFGDASGLRVIDTPAGRVGTLICWESYMPLARYALYAQGLQIYVTPTYDNGERTLATMQHVAREGGCWVVCCGSALQARDLPDDLPGRGDLFRDADEWINAGDSVVVAPGGKVVAGPLHDQRGILYADLDLERIGAARRSLDVSGHYARPDLFQLRVNNQPQRSVSFDRAAHDRHAED
ncbi:MAG TPA: carbon-nitrogen hydrolase family protein [Burkholderiaceae bacterium]|nr:carbon-nitrogen hydrolase family protein [Burkholderiaceae bacterium]